MASRGTTQRERRLDREIEAYRGAADLALDQLQWVINYLHRIRKDRIAAVLDRNRAHILKEARRDR